MNSCGSSRSCSPPKSSAHTIAAWASKLALQGDQASCGKQKHGQGQRSQAAAGLCVTALLSTCRFDRELVFPLPSVAARTSILGIHTAKWREPPSKELRQDLANLCVGYCGADLKARLDTAQDALLDTQAWGLACAHFLHLTWRVLFLGSVSASRLQIVAQRCRGVLRHGVGNICLLSPSCLVLPVLSTMPA